MSSSFDPAEPRTQSSGGDFSLGEPGSQPPSRAVDEVVLTRAWETESDYYDPRRGYSRPQINLATHRLRLPLILFALTALSTFFAGATGWIPHELLFIADPIPLRRALLLNWWNGVVYSVCLLSMLFAHEMGHFLATVYYRIHASFPFFIPLPITPIGTMGAVIGMDNREADRKEMFDIGIAGPLAGLVVAIPLLWIGVQRLDFNVPADGPLAFGLPWGARLLVQNLSPPGYAGQTAVNVSQVNPYFMAGWVGLLVTALNMMPVSQLDGGHVTYTLFGRAAHWIARALVVFGIAHMIYTDEYQMSLMIGLILLIGIDHPPTSNDRVPLGWFRYALGLASLAIPVFCLTPQAIVQR